MLTSHKFKQPIVEMQGEVQALAGRRFFSCVCVFSQKQNEFFQHSEKWDWMPKTPGWAGSWTFAIRPFIIQLFLVGDYIHYEKGTKASFHKQFATEKIGV